MMQESVNNRNRNNNNNNRIGSYSIIIQTMHHQPTVCSLAGSSSPYLSEVSSISQVSSLNLASNNTSTAQQTSRSKVNRLWDRLLLRATPDSTRPTMSSKQSTSSSSSSSSSSATISSNWSSTLSLHSNWLSSRSPSAALSSATPPSSQSMPLSVASFLLPSASTIFNYYHSTKSSNYSLFDSDDDDNDEVDDNDNENEYDVHLYHRRSGLFERNQNCSNLIFNQQNRPNRLVDRRSSSPSCHPFYSNPDHHKTFSNLPAPPPPYQPINPHHGSTMLTSRQQTSEHATNQHQLVNSNRKRASTRSTPPRSPPPPYFDDSSATATSSDLSSDKMVAILAVHEHCSSPISLSHCPAVISSTPLIDKQQQNQCSLAQDSPSPKLGSSNNGPKSTLTTSTTSSSFYSSSSSSSSSSSCPSPCPPQYSLFDISEYESIDVNHNHNDPPVLPTHLPKTRQLFFDNVDFYQQFNCFHHWNPFCFHEISNSITKRRPRPETVPGQEPPPSSLQSQPPRHSLSSVRTELTTDTDSKTTSSKSNQNNNNIGSGRHNQNNNRNNNNIGKTKSKSQSPFALNCKILLVVIMGILATLLLLALFIAFGPIDGSAKHRLESPSARINSAPNSPMKSLLRTGGVSGVKQAENSLGNRRRKCHTDVCRRAGRQLYQSINFTVNPCDNFYEYACGMWINKNPIPDDKSKISTFNSLDEVLKTNLKTALETARKNKRGTNAEPSTQAKSPPNAVSVQYAIDLYHECMDRDSIERLDIGPIQELLSQLFGAWPMLKPAIARSSDSENAWQETFVHYFSKTAISPIFSVTIQPDSNLTATKRIHFDAPEFGLGRKEYKDISAYNDTVTAYKLYMNRIGKLFSGTDLEKTLQERFDELFEFESKLALASTPQEDRRDASVWYNPMTLSEFKKLTGNQIDWTAVLNAILIETNANVPALTNEDLVIVNDIPYYKEVSKLVTETPEYIINNYLGWILASSVADYGSDRLYDIDFQHNKVVTGIKQKPPIWRRCVKQVYGELSLAISRLYIDQFVNRETKQKATLLIKSLKESFATVVEQGEWLDQITRERALQKLNSMRENVAYPDWVEDNSELDKYYGMRADVSVEPGKYFQSFIKIRQVILTSQWSKLNNPVNLTTSWPMPPAMVNAAYDPTQNSMTIPVGILYPPFFEAGRPPSMNYGGIGTVIGHEITHGFDDQGRQFDKMGNLAEWWTDSTKKRFDIGSKCFVDQYSAIKDPLTKKNLNGANTVGENIADNGGLRESYLAYRKYIDNSPNPEPTLPYMKKFTSDQIFFLSYANIWCGSARPEMLSMLIDYDPHSPGTYRINVPLSNFFDEFSRAFNCPADSPMNAKNRCQVW